MAKKEEFDSIFEQVLQIPILDVIEAFVEKLDMKKTGANYQGCSPFRVDSSTSSFTISPSRGIFKDWVMTDYTGNSIKFVSMYKNLTYFEACLTIALKFNIIDNNFYTNTLSKKPPRDIVLYEKKYSVSKVREESHIADEYTLHKVYSIFLECCKLSDNHLTYLKEKRHLTDEEIAKYKLFTFPSRGILRTFLKRITEAFDSTDVLGRIPGFYKRVKEDNFTFMRYAGIGIPIFNEKGNIVGIQIRKDTDDGQRYTWFSSAFAINDEKKENEKGTSSGSPVAVIYPNKIKYKTIFITEGFFKAAEIAKNFNCIVLSVQGVSTWKPIKAIIDNLFNVISIPNYEIKYVCPAFDADMCRNINVYMQLKKMTDSLKADRDFIINYICWDMNLGKGIDDMLLDGHKEELKAIDKDSYDRSYQILIKKIIEERADIENQSQICTKLTCEEFGQFYDKYFNLDGFIAK